MRKEKIIVADRYMTLKSVKPKKNQFNMCSYEYPTEIKRQLSRLYNLKLKKMGNK